MITIERFFGWSFGLQYGDLNQILSILKKLIVQISDMNLCIWGTQRKKHG